ncbi:MAG: tetratricopeptide repeat protein [Deltaproteobacteria bacterium]|nr:tetratricopeptide repeat protein [Deltaproteobacteria bacterium]
MTRKLERIRAVAEARPDDPFVWYSLAMEERKSAPDGALHTFERVRNRFPDYVPAYYQQATLLIERQQLERARIIVLEGIEAARRARDAHAESELTSLLGTL